MKKIKNLISVLGFAFVLTAGFIPLNAHAASVIADQCAGVTDSAVCKDQNAKPNDLIKNIVNTLLYVVGAISVVVIIIGGIMYATSAGDSGRVTKAKNAITYAVIGLIVSFLAFAVVQFVVSKFK
jgi:hypothetical protein